MRESVIYQDILQEGMEKGWEKGWENGRQKEGLSVMLNVLINRWGTIPADLQAKLESLSVERIEELSRVCFDLQNVSELADWLQQPSKQR